MTQLPPIERRIFVVGVPRSGTTLVQSLLAAHSQVTSFTESHLFSRHFALWGPFARPVLVRDPAPRLVEFLEENDAGPVPGPATSRDDLTRLSPPWWLRPIRTRRVAAQLLRVFDQLAAVRGHRTWVEKTCRHLRYMPYLERLLGPTALPHVVHVIREGPAVVASLHAASQHWERPYGLSECAQRWNDDVTFSLGRAGSPNDHFVFYTDLTTHPRQTLEPLLAALGLAWEPGLLEDYRATARRLVAPGETWKDDVDRDIKPSPVSGRLLTPSQRRQVAGLIDGTLYERVHKRVHPAGSRRDTERAR